MDRFLRRFRQRAINSRDSRAHKIHWFGGFKYLRGRKAIKTSEKSLFKRFSHFAESAEVDVDLFRNSVRDVYGGAEARNAQVRRVRIDGHAARAAEAEEREMDTVQCRAGQCSQEEIKTIFKHS